MIIAMSYKPVGVCSDPGAYLQFHKKTAVAGSKTMLFQHRYGWYVR